MVQAGARDPERMEEWMSLFDMWKASLPNSKMVNTVYEDDDTVNTALIEMKSLEESSSATSTPHVIHSATYQEQTLIPTAPPENEQEVYVIDSKQKHICISTCHG